MSLSIYAHGVSILLISGSYCALTVAALTNLLTPELTANCAEFICRCVTFAAMLVAYQRHWMTRVNNSVGPKRTKGASGLIPERKHITAIRIAALQPWRC